ncbi:uncharacterized protein LOC135119071 [Helicoverpa armigera]|uniref:uncharacterized protein LOC135119071 n=1 Tax=Helicoverpa armigera TaxID=29058 RepID=UPI003082F2C2
MKSFSIFLSFFIFLLNNVLTHDESQNTTYQNTTDNAIFESSTIFALDTVRPEKIILGIIDATPTTLDLAANNATILLYTNTSLLRNNETYGVNDTRRQNYKDKKAVEAMKDKAVKKKLAPEKELGLGEPYWPQGDWVFLR